MLECKRGRERIQSRGFSKTVVFLAAAIIIIFAASGVGAQEKATGTASVSAQEVISLNVTQMDLQDVLRLVAEKANLNIIISKEVAGTVTLRLKNVDLWQALGAILETNGFTYREEEGIIRVVKAKELGEVKTPLLETKIIFLKFARAEDVKKAFQHLLSASGTMEIDATSNALIVTDIPEDIENIKKRVAELEEAAREKIEKEEVEKERIEEVIETLQKKVAELEEAAREKIEKEELPPPVLERERFQLNYIDTTEKEKKDLLKDALGNIIGEEGNFFIDSLTNSVYVEAPSSCIEKIKEYFEGMDVSPKRIMIKAEFVEVRLTAEEELGIKWRWKGAYEKYPLGSTFRYPYYTRPEPGETVPSREALSTLAAGMGIIFGSAEQEFRGIIDLLISEGKGHLLSSPTIVTLEGHEAKIDVGDEHPYRVTRYIEGAWVETIETVTVGATLVVTPHIKGEKRIVLDIHPKVSELTGPPPFTGAPPIIGTRETETQISVEDGETIVIGGLLRNTEKETRAGVPFLSRLPILGSLFSHKTIEKKRTDLLVFITPYILSEKLEEENIVEKRKPLRVQVDELYQKGLDYEKNEEYEKAEECFEEVINKSRIFGFSDYLKYAEKELANLEKLEEKRLEKEKREQARLEKERLEQERLEKKRLEKERREQARLERIKKAKLEKERITEERLEKERLAKEEREKARLEKARLEKERLERRTLVKELYQKGWDYKKAGEYEKARESFEEVIKRSRIYGFSDYLKSAEKELLNLEKLEGKRLEEEKREIERIEKIEK